MNIKPAEGPCYFVLRDLGEECFGPLNQPDVLLLSCRSLIAGCDAAQDASTSAETNSYTLNISGRGAETSCTAKVVDEYDP